MKILKARTSSFPRLYSVHPRTTPLPVRHPFLYSLNPCTKYNQLTITMSANPIGEQVIYCGITFGVLCTIAVGLRLLSRSRCKANLSVDDFLIALCLGPLWGMVVIGCLGAYDFNDPEGRS